MHGEDRIALGITLVGYMLFLGVMFMAVSLVMS
jgi:hypothetical protein